MHDNAIPISRVITGALWTWVLLLLIAAWVVWGVVGQHGAGAMLGLTACVSAAAAGVAQVRCYTLRMIALIRVAHGLDGETHTVELRPMR